MLDLPKNLTHVQARACLKALLQGLRSEAGTNVQVDATALSHFDSAALAVLLACRRESLALGKQFSIRGLSPQLADLASLYGIAELLPSV